MQAETEIEWRSAEFTPPCRGVFVEVARGKPSEFDDIAVGDSKKTPVDRVYWDPTKWNARGLYWRYCAAPNFLATETPVTERPPIEEDDWLVVLLEPQQEIPTTYRIHEDSRELFVPIIRRRVKTGRTGRNGQKVTRIIPKPMFPGYGLIRAKAYGKNINHLLAVRGVRDVLRDKSQTETGEWLGRPITIPHEAVLAIFRKQSQKHHEFHQEFSWRKRPRFKPSDKVRIEAEGNVYDGQLATIEKDDGGARIKVLLGMARISHSLPAEMVVSAV